MNNVALEKIPLSDLINWSVRYLLDVSFDYNQDYDLFPIGDFLEKNRNVTTIQDEVEYRRVTVKVNNNGVTLRNTELGKNIGTKKQYIVSSGQFILSKIDARNGALGLIPPNLDGAIVTNDFPTFNLNTQKINPQFLVLVTTTKQFIKFAQSCSSGTTNRQRIDLNLFLNIKIPLPSLQEQNRIVDNYNAKIELAQEQEARAKQLKIDIETYLFDVLGIQEFVQKKKSIDLNFVSFSKVSRWDSLFLIGKISKLVSTKYEIKRFSDIISCFNKNHAGESLRINSGDFPNDNFYYIGMEDIEKETGNLLQINSVAGVEIKSQTLKVPRNFIIYGKLRPYLNKYWLNDSGKNNTICSSEFFVFDINELIFKPFFKYVLSSQFIQYQILDKTSGARMPRINEAIFNDLQFPFPQLKTQKVIATHITQLKKQIESLRNQAKKNRTQSIIEFEKEIFTP